MRTPIRTMNVDQEIPGARFSEALRDLAALAIRVAEELGPIYAVNMIKKIEVLEKQPQQADQNGA